MNELMDDETPTGSVDPALETIPCPLCGSERSDILYDSVDFQSGCPGRFITTRCAQCEFVFLNPRPTRDAIGGFYSGAYYAYEGNVAAPPPRGLKNLIRRTIRRSRTLSGLCAQVPVLREATRDVEFARDIKDWIPPGRVLDVGCGAGTLLDGLRSSGWGTFGLEIDSTAAGRAWAHGHVVIPSAVDTHVAPLPAASQFDLIVFNHSLEHVHDPALALNRARGWIRDHGLLVVEVPNVDSVLTDHFGEYALAFDPPRHLSMFSPRTLRTFLANAGFEPVSIRHSLHPGHFERCRQYADQETRDHEGAIDSAASPSQIAHAMEQGRGAAFRIVARPTG